MTKVSEAVFAFDRKNQLWTDTKMIQTFCIRSKYLLPCLQIDQSRLIAATVVVIAAVVVGGAAVVVVAAVISVVAVIAVVVTVVFDIVIVLLSRNTMSQF